MNTRDGHETLTLLLQPKGIQCASTGHYPHLPSWKTVQPATTRVPWSRDNFPRRTQGVPQAVAMSHQPLHHRLVPHSVPLPPPSWVSQSPLISCSFNPLLSWWRTDGWGWPTGRGGAKSKAEPQELCEQRREREISPCSLRRSRLNLHNQLDVTCVCGITE